MPHGYSSESGVVDFRMRTPRSTDSSSTPYSNSSAYGLPNLPGYELLEQIGRGGMGVVYKARQLALNRLVAIKLLPNAEKAGQTTIARFFAEAQSVADVRHPNVVEVYDFGEVTVRNTVHADDTAEYIKVPYLVMELLDNGQYGDGRHPVNPRDPRQVVAILAKVSRGLAAAHKAGIVHRDIKPGNILFSRSGEPKVVDFGLAKRAMSNLTLSVAVMGTPYYMSPEQAKGKSKVVGPPTDVWAIGVLLYESLTGCLPFDAENHYSLMHQIITENPDPPRIHNADLPRDLEAIIMKCLEKNPEKRYPTAAKLADALEKFHQESGMFVPLKPVATGSRRYRERTLTLVFALLFGIIGTCFWLWQKAESEKRELHEKALRILQNSQEKVVME